MRSGRFKSTWKRWSDMRYTTHLVSLLLPLVLLAFSCDNGDQAETSDCAPIGDKPSGTPLQLVIMGPPGAGKGTQARRISDKYRIAHISTGAILRSEVEKGTDLGLEVESIMERGELVADEIVLDLVEARLNEPDCKHGFILDGFPRTIPQAEALQSILERRGSTATHLVVIDLAVPDEELARRLLQRKRADDTESTIQNRIRVYHERTAPLRLYYEKRSALRQVDGNQPIEDVFREVVGILGGD